METQKGINVGSIVARTLDVIKANAQPVMIFMGVLVLIGSLADYGMLSDPLLGSLLQLVVVVVGIIAIYQLFESFLQQQGLYIQHGPRRYLPYLGMSMLTGLGTVIGLVFLIIPGLILAARWSLSGALLVGRGELVTDAMSKSWELTRPHVVPIIIAGLVMIILLIALIFYRLPLFPKIA